VGGKKYIERFDPIVFVALGTMVSLVALLPALAFTEVTPPGEISMGTWGAVLALGALCTVVSYGLFFNILRHREASRTTMYVYLVPVFGVGGGVVILGETIGPLTVAGAALILAGVWVVTGKGGG
jgi:drug/metabolite transporter (DMT)-like permease